MIHINELRRLALDGDLYAVQEIIARLEAAERERDECNARRLEVADYFSAQVREISSALEETRRERDVEQQRACDLHVECYNLITEIDALRAKVADMEKQESVAEWIENKFDQYPQLIWDEKYKAVVGTKLYALPGAQAQLAPSVPSVPDDVIEQAVTRFLSWKLPKDFNPDGSIVFIPTKGRGYDSPHWPIGTNLFTAEQAREMLRYALAALREELSKQQSLSQAAQQLAEVAQRRADALRAKIEAMEKQEPHSYIYRYWNPLDGSPVWRHEPGDWNGQQPGACAPLYALPGAKGE